MAFPSISGADSANPWPQTVTFRHADQILFVTKSAAFDADRIGFNFNEYKINILKRLFYQPDWYASCI